MSREAVSPVSILRRMAPLASLVGAAALFWAIEPSSPLSVMDARMILVQTVIVAMVALGMSVVMVSGGIDLSVGSGVALCSIAAAEVMQGEWGGSWRPVVAVLAAISAGALCGLYNGVLVAGLRLPPFIATLGTLGFFRGLAKWISDGRTVYADAGWLNAWVSPVPLWKWMLVAPAVWMMLALAGVVAAFLGCTVPGRWAVAMGSNEEAARRAGVPVPRVKVMVYVICGALVGMAGVVQFARLGGLGDPTIQVGLELNAIAAVVIGGASLSGGTVSVMGAVCGALLMALLDNRCTALGWPNYVQEMVVGHIIIIAVGLDRWRKRK